MRTILFIVLASMPLTVQANVPKKKVDLKPRHEKVEDPGAAEPLIYKSPADTAAIKKEAGGIKITASCTDQMGMVVKSSDAGYESCLKNQDKLRPHKADEKNPNSVGFTIGK